MSDIVLSKENITDHPVFISGLTRSGKSLLCPIVSSFNNVEKVNVNFFLEQMPFLHFLNKMPEDTAVFLLKAGMNLMVYDNAIGRNTNFRPDDYTSIWKYRNPMDYIQRLFQPDGDKVIRQLDNDNKIFPMMVHNGLWHAKLWFKAFPTLKLIHMQRNPAEIVYSWMGKGYGGEFYSNKRTNISTYMYDDEILPYYAYGWEGQYLAFKGVDRIIHMVHRIRKHHEETYERLDEKVKKHILFIRHETFLAETKKSLTILSDFIGEDPTDDTNTILSQENCPRVIDINERQLKIEAIKKSASPNEFEMLMGMVEQFESTELAI